MLTLQINTSGSWKNVMQFGAQRRDDVLAGVARLAQALGDRVKWCLLHEDGRREWLQDIRSGASTNWDSVTPTSPPPLQDVLVSAWDASEGAGIVYMAWRSAKEPDHWVLSGSEERLILPVYAWAPIMAPSKEVPAELRRKEAWT